MPFRMMPLRLVVLATAALGLAACAGLARPGNELWPYGYTGSGGVGAQAAPAATLEPAGVATPEAVAENGPAALVMRDAGGQRTTYLTNRSAREISVVFQLEGQPIQQVTVPPGSEMQVGSTSGRIIAVR